MSNTELVLLALLCITCFTALGNWASFNRIENELKSIKKANLYLAELLGDKQDLAKAIKEADTLTTWEIYKQMRHDDA